MESSYFTLIQPALGRPVTQELLWLCSNSVSSVAKNVSFNAASVERLFGLFEKCQDFSNFRKGYRHFTPKTKRRSVAFAP